MELLSRRAALVAAATATVSSLAPPSRAAPAARPDLPIPPELRPDADHRILLQARTGSMSFLPGRTTPTYGINGPFLGPAVRVRRGETIEAVVRNTVPQPITLHWHGLIIPGSADGGPHREIPTGGEWRVQLPIDQPAATLWFHPHSYPTTAELVIKGIAGLLIVDDQEADRLPLPRTWGVDDIPLVIQDRRFRPDGHFFERFNLSAVTNGYVGDTVLVNGAIHPEARTARGWLRLRILNGSNARSYTLAASDGRTLHVIGSDGGLLSAPVPLAQLAIHAGERFELMVDARDGKPFDILTLPGDQPIMRLPPFDKALSLVTLRPDGAEGAGQLPDSLVTLPPLPDTLPPVSQELVMDMFRDKEGMMVMEKAGLGMGGMAGGMGDTAGAGAMGGMASTGGMHSMSGKMPMEAMQATNGMQHAGSHAAMHGMPAKGPINGMTGTGSISPSVVARVTNLIVNGPALPLAQQLSSNGINGRSFSLHEKGFSALRDQPLRWRISEGTDQMPHPVHIHGCQFRILTQDGKPPPPHLAGWKDTAPIAAGGNSEVFLRFPYPAGPDAPYMAHCHILEHEDSGMMTQFTVA